MLTPGPCVLYLISPISASHDFLIIFPRLWDLLLFSAFDAVRSQLDMASRIVSHRHQTATSIHSSRFAFPFILCLLLIILNAANPVDAVLTTCYDPSGDERPDKPCFPDAVNSFCCATDWGMLPTEHFSPPIC